MPLSVKAFHLRDWRGESKQIRRFSVDDDVAASFTYLAHKIASVFRLNRSCFLRWKDEDGDFIDLSNDEELLEALSKLSGDTLKIYFTVSSGDSSSSSSSSSSDEDDEPTHPGVTCDGCERRVAGSRFKCTICPDYDLCWRCERHGLHPEHDMLRIRQPRLFHAWTHPGQRQGFRGAGSWPWFGFGSGGACPGWAGRGPRCRPAWCGKPKSCDKGGDCGKRTRGGCGGEEKPQPRSNPCGGFGVPGVNAQVMEDVTKAVAGVLEPLGVQFDLTTVQDMMSNLWAGTGCMPTPASASAPPSQPPPPSSQPQAPSQQSPGVSPPGSCPYAPQMPSAPADEQGGEKWRATLDQLLEMGFNDEGGWLSGLVQSMDGDMTRVLDAIQPHAPNSTGY